MMGVPLFLGLSGFLVWNSVKTTESCSVFFHKRVFRIYPELWIAVVIEIVTIFIFYKEKIEYAWLFLFAITQSTVLQFWTPGFLRGYGCGTPNGSLWTISTIVQFYVVVWIVRKWLTNRKPIFWGILFCATVLVSCFTPLLSKFLPEIGYNLFRQTFIPYAWLFVLGVLICEFSNRIIPFLRRFWIPLLIAYVIIRFQLSAVDLPLCGYPFIGSVLMILSVIGIAYAFPSLNVKKDISYGIYLYHMIVVNVMIQLGLTEQWYYLLVVIALTVLMSICSLHIVDRANKIIGHIKQV